MTDDQKESLYELQKVDCNCNNCAYFQRDMQQTKDKNNNPQLVANKIHYGHCMKLDKEVGEIANLCLLHTQECFVHRRDIK